MPKVVDHDERRRLIADQVLRGAASEGLAGVSMRAVASGLGWSLGTIQHYFETRDAMLEFAVAELGRRRSDRVRAELASLGRPPTERDILRASALAGVPLDDERRQECLAEAAFFSWMVAGRDGAGARGGADGVQDLLAFFESLLRSAQRRGVLACGVDPKPEAAIGWAIVSSQAQGALVGAADPVKTVATIDYWLDRILPVDASAAVPAGRAPERPRPSHEAQPAVAPAGPVIRATEPRGRGV